MKKNLIVLLLAIGSTVLFSLASFSSSFWPGRFDERYTLLFYMAGVVSIATMAAIYTSHTYSLRRALSKKTKEFLLEGIRYHHSSMLGVRSLFFQYGKEEKTPEGIESFKGLAALMLSEKYSQMENIQSFATTIGIDYSFAQSFLEDDCRDIFEQSIQYGAVQSKYRGLFSDELKYVISDRDPDRAKVLLGWAKDQLAPFNPFHEFTEELAEVKSIASKAA